MSLMISVRAALDIFVIARNPNMKHQQRSVHSDEDLTPKSNRRWNGTSLISFVSLFLVWEAVFNSIAQLITPNLTASFSAPTPARPVLSPSGFVFVLCRVFPHLSSSHLACHPWTEWTAECNTEWGLMLRYLSEQNPQTRTE